MYSLKIHLIAKIFATTKQQEKGMLKEKFLWFLCLMIPFVFFLHTCGHIFLNVCVHQRLQYQGMACMGEMIITD